jgi:hypothetical protein
MDGGGGGIAITEVVGAAAVLPYVLLHTSNDSHGHRLYQTLAASAQRPAYVCLRNRLVCDRVVRPFPNAVLLCGVNGSQAAFLELLASTHLAAYIFRVYFCQHSALDLATVSAAYGKVIPPDDVLRLQCYPRSVEAELGKTIPMSVDLRMSGFTTIGSVVKLPADQVRRPSHHRRCCADGQPECGKCGKSASESAMQRATSRGMVGWRLGGVAVRSDRPWPPCSWQVPAIATSPGGRREHTSWRRPRRRPRQPRRRAARRRRRTRGMLSRLTSAAWVRRADCALRHFTLATRWPPTLPAVEEACAQRPPPTAPAWLTSTVCHRLRVFTVRHRSRAPTKTQTASRGRRTS